MQSHPDRQSLLPEQIRNHGALVEDNEINCETVEFMLKEAGAKVVTANDGKAAVDAFTAVAPGTLLGLFSAI